MTLSSLPMLMLEPVVRAALLEDLGRAGDLTTDAIVPASARAETALVARQPGIVAGLDAASLDGDVFVKGVRGKGAVGAAAYSFDADGRYRAETGEALTRDALMARVTDASAQRDQLVTRRLRNHPEIADLAVESLITFRVFTCIDAAGQPIVTHAMLRTVSKLEPS